ncbi:DNA-binding protein [Hornefia butyriciproducens]|uniref:DNA-binding protein n=1 Tax=Hornefia butyriciproducens TaxID=2652293 RepID=UPI002A914083|nr:DNA-binding protein [Hornefia butyriciproducens]MDY6212076.1 DNA-binding protein [Hornefia butyriciproducens]
MEYLTAAQTAEKWNISRHRVSKLCSEGRIEGAKLMGNVWLAPEDAKKPEDMRLKIKEEK